MYNSRLAKQELQQEAFRAKSRAESMGALGWYDCPSWKQDLFNGFQFPPYSIIQNIVYFFTLYAVFIA